MKSTFWVFGISCFIIILVFILFGNLENDIMLFLKNLKENKINYSIASFIILASDVFLPIPSSLVLYSNGYVLNFEMGLLISLIASTLSSIIGYFTGKLSSKLIHKNEIASSFLTKYGSLALLVSRGIPIISESITIVCGYSNFSFKKFILLNILGYIPICSIFCYFGSLGYHYKNLFIITFLTSILFAFLILLLSKSIIEKRWTIKKN
ncbi:MAG: VTT domain-containing protein [Fluviicola sp.]|jgi:membrane protein DedA with SNARE-associated domain